MTPKDFIDWLYPDKSCFVCGKKIHLNLDGDFHDEQLSHAKGIPIDETTDSKTNDSHQSVQCPYSGDTTELLKRLCDPKYVTTYKCPLHGVCTSLKNDAEKNADVHENQIPPPSRKDF